MSTVMYAYRIKKKIFWGFVDRVRKLYQSEHVLYNLKFKTAPTNNEEAIQYYESVREMHRKLNEFGSELQVFDYDVDHYLFRVTERNYFFLNARNANDDWPIDNYWYDTRADLIVLNDEKMREVAEWMDVRVYNKHYFLVPLASTDLLDEFYMKKLLIDKDWQNV